jgi:Flp pilus assembly protein TadG
VFCRLRRTLRRGLRQEGAAAVEFALCLIPLLLIVAGVVDYGESWYMQSVLATASREGARYATRYQTSPATGQRLIPNALSPSVQNYVLKTPAENGGSTQPGYGLKTILPSNASPAVTPGGTGYTSGTTGAAVNVTVSAQKYWLMLNYLIPGLTNPQTLASTTTMSCE